MNDSAERSAKEQLKDLAAELQDANLGSFLCILFRNWGISCRFTTDIDTDEKGRTVVQQRLAEIRAATNPLTRVSCVIAIDIVLLRFWEAFGLGGETDRSMSLVGGCSLEQFWTECKHRWWT